MIIAWTILVLFSVLTLISWAMFLEGFIKGNVPLKKEVVADFWISIFMTILTSMPAQYIWG